MLISGGFDDKDVQVTHDCVRYVKELNSNQEEADTRMMLHVKYSGNHNGSLVVLVSPDTDVLVLLIYHFSELGVSELYFKTGRTSIYASYTRFIPIHTGRRSAVGNVCGYRCVSDCRSRGREFNPGPVPYFRGD